MQAEGILGAHNFPFFSQAGIGQQVIHAFSMVMKDHFIVADWAPDI
jgi:hypothetical protein